MSLSLEAIFNKLDGICRQTLEQAIAWCWQRGHYEVEIEHWLIKILEEPRSDLIALCRFYEIDHARLREELLKSLERVKTGSPRRPYFSTKLVDLARDAWLFGSLEFAAQKTRSGYLLYAVLADRHVGRAVMDASEQLQRVSVEALRKDLEDVVREGDEADSATAPGAPTGSLQEFGDAPALAQYTQDLTALARQGRIDPVVGRDAEIRQMIDILTRRRQNNPILTGEAGVGKTAVVEGLAHRIAQGEVPGPLRHAAIHSLDLGLLQAGASVKGEFESRLKAVLDEVKASAHPIIVFIDEAHTLIGAGGAAGQGDAANLLKPALARGEFRTIAATTWSEYKKYFEKDAALTRRFQVVKVDEPSELETLEILRGLRSTLHRHHGTVILDEALRDAARLSHRYIPGRQLPDKAISVLDTACARVAMSQAATPPPIEACQRRLAQVTQTSEQLAQEVLVGIDHAAALSELEQEREDVTARLQVLEARFGEEQGLVAEILDLERALWAGPPADLEGEVIDQREMQERLRHLTERLEELQRDEPLISARVDAKAVAEVISSWTGVPLGRMVQDELAGLLSLKQRLERRVVGQAHALEEIVKKVQTARAGLEDPRKPVGVFLMVGPSGVGKTETALALAELLYGGEHALTVLNMSEFKEEHKVSLLMGSPPGYVGYGEGGVLTEAVRRRPYGIVLLDEMEKAHPGVQEVFYQVFDKGSMRDGEGRDIDFKNTVLIMTANVGSDEVFALCRDPDTSPSPEGLAKALWPVLTRTFKPAFLGRVTLVPYYPLTEGVLTEIASLHLGRVARRVREAYGVPLTWEPRVIETIVQRCQDAETGARNIEHILAQNLVPGLSREFLSRMAAHRPPTPVRVDVDADRGFLQHFDAEDDPETRMQARESSNSRQITGNIGA